MMNHSSAYKPVLPDNPKREDWRYFKRQFNNYLLIVEAGDEQKLPLLLNAVGRNGLDIYDGLPAPKDSFDTAISRFDTYFSSNSSLLLRRKTFYEARQGLHESVQEFACRLRRLIHECDFGESANTLLRDIFVTGIRNNHLGERLLAEDAQLLTFDSAIAKAEAFERARVERQSFNPNNSVSALSCSYNRTKLPKQASSQSPHGSCYRCGSKHHLANSEDCPAKKSSCRKCLKVGHYSKCCRNSKPIAAVSAGNPPNPDNDGRENILSIYASDSLPDMVRNVQLNGISTDILIDTGASVNIIPEGIIPLINMRPTTARVSAWGNFPVPVIGEITVTVNYNSQTLSDTFIVVKPNCPCMPLFSAKLCRNLGILSEIANIENANCSPMIEYYKTSGLFSGVGLLKNYSHKIELNPDIKPVQTPPRKLPPSIISEINTEINKLLSQGIIKKLDEPTEWSSALVVARKRDGQVRLCTDLRPLNKAVRVPHHPIPDVDELFARIDKSKFYTILDCTSAFHQISLDPDSQKLLTFLAPTGQYCWTRMPYGLKSAPEVWTSVLTNLLKDIPKVFVFYDDILIATNDETEHNHTLNRVFDVLLKNGITLNYEKCRILRNKIDFLGHTLNENGINPSASKIEAIKNVPLPKTKDQLRSFLGLANYIGQRFVPSFASLAAPLWQLFSKAKLSLTWDSRTTSAFLKLKNAICSCKGIAWFDHTKDVVIQSDASGDGIACCLLQAEIPVAFASRKLSDTEKRYSVIEKEFLAINFALLKFRRLILFKNIELQTDHKPILGLMDKPIDKLPIRIQKWMLQIQSFDINLKYIPGHENILSDSLSRNPVDSNEGQDDIEYTICNIFKAYDIDFKQIAEATRHDNKLQLLIQAINNEWTNTVKTELSAYFPIRQELSLIRCRPADPDSIIILKGHQVVVPCALQSSVLKMLHDGHLGVNKMKSLAQSSFYWPNFNRNIEQYVRQCAACTVFQTQADKAPLVTVADKCTFPYEVISVDITGPSEGALKGHTLLTIIDYYSRYPESYILRKCTASEIIDCLSQTFSRCGIPNRLVSDNGSQFRSQEFLDFIKDLKIEHSFSSNYFPAANGCIERFHSTLKSRLKRLFYDHDNVEFSVALNKVLFDMRRTPHSSTGETPFQLFFLRQMPTTISKLSIENVKIDCPKRNLTKEYYRYKARNVDYKPGDKIFYRKGAGNNFFNEGQIIEKVGRNSYKIMCREGYTRIYNQSNLKKRYIADTYAYDEADIAYDSVIAINESNDNGSSENVTHANTPRYNLRKKNIDPSVYKV